MRRKSQKEGIGMADSLCCTVETNAILQSNQTPIEIKKKKQKVQVGLMGLSSALPAITEGASTGLSLPESRNHWDADLSPGGWESGGGGSDSTV